MRRVRCAAILFLAFLAGPQALPQGLSVPANPNQPAASAPPLGTGPAPDLDLVFTSQVVGYIEPCG
jgi:hypothetical protein